MDLDYQTREMVAVARQLSALTGLSLSTLGHQAVQETQFFPRLIAGGTCRCRTYTKAMLYMASRWPAYAPVPEPLRFYVALAGAPATAADVRQLTAAELPAQPA